MRFLTAALKILLEPAKNPIADGGFFTDLAEARKKVEAVRQQLEHQVTQLRGKAACLLEDDSREAILREASALDEQIKALEREQERLRAAEQRLEVLSVCRSAAEIQARAGEVIGGVSDVTAELHRVLEQAEENTDRIKARAAVIRELVLTWGQASSTEPRP